MRAAQPRSRLQRQAMVSLCAVTLLVLLARAAPAGVVAADLILLVLDDRGRVGRGARTARGGAGHAANRLARLLRRCAVAGRLPLGCLSGLVQRRGLAFELAARVADARWGRRFVLR